MPIDHKLIDNLLKDYKTPDEILGDNGMLKQLTKAVLERAMQAELTEHLGYEPHDAAGDNSGNSRNDKSRKRGFGPREPGRVSAHMLPDLCIFHGPGVEGGEQAGVLVTGSSANPLRF